MADLSELEITLLCAKALGYVIRGNALAPHCPWPVGVRVSVGKKAPRWFSPLYDDAKIVALVKKLNLTVGKAKFDSHGAIPIGNWMATDGAVLVDDPDLNRAICKCVAKMQAEKESKNG